MIQVVVISHGRFCDGLLDTLEMVCGGDFGIRTLGLIPGTSPEEYRERLTEILTRCVEEDSRGALVLADIAGGTPFNSAVYLRSKFRIGIVAGVNMPMLMTLAMDRDESDTIESLLEKAELPLALGFKTISPDVSGKRSHAKLSAHKD